LFVETRHLGEQVLQGAAGSLAGGSGRNRLHGQDAIVLKSINPYA
jgi:hypothetical protein